MSEVGEEKERIAQAVAQGYPDVDQTCPHEGCGRVFKNYHHFLQCDNPECPMKDGNGTLLEQLGKLWGVE